ncbi:hypothetical protein AB0H34_38865 [Saccharopolyspora shandongensis]|uniref:hypothetical protein n=1 Tax=Saccharopolyspora shandongensis TaxID=418495 RepID=UPI0033F49E59
MSHSAAEDDRLTELVPAAGSGDRRSLEQSQPANASAPPDSHPESPWSSSISTTNAP